MTRTLRMAARCTAVAVCLATAGCAFKSQHDDIIHITFGLGFLLHRNGEIEFSINVIRARREEAQTRLTLLESVKKLAKADRPAALADDAVIEAQEAEAKGRLKALDEALESLESGRGGGESND
jgi:hypothetical protein